MADPMQLMRQAAPTQVQTAQAAPAPAQAPAQPSPQAGLQELNRIARDSNANASPQKNAADIDAIANVLLIEIPVLHKVIEMLAQEIAKLKGAQPPEVM